MEEELLSRLLLNHLVIGQFELARAAAEDLFRKNPRQALCILRDAIACGGKLPGCLKSASVKSPAHLVWLCLCEYVRLLTTAGCKQLPRGAIARAEFELLLESLPRGAGDGNEYAGGGIDDYVDENLDDDDDEEEGAGTGGDTVLMSNGEVRALFREYLGVRAEEPITLDVPEKIGRERELDLEGERETMEEHQEEDMEGGGGREAATSSSFSELLQAARDPPVSGGASSTGVVASSAAAAAEAPRGAPPVKEGRRGGAKREGSHAPPPVAERRGETIPPGTKRVLYGLSMHHPELVDALCRNAWRRQHVVGRGLETEQGGKSGTRGRDVLFQAIQDAQFSVIGALTEAGDYEGACRRLRYLSDPQAGDDGPRVDKLRGILKQLAIKGGLIDDPKRGGEKTRENSTSPEIAAKLFESAVTSGSTGVLLLLESVLDEAIRDNDVRKNSLRGLQGVPAPLVKLCEALDRLRRGALEGGGAIDESLVQSALVACWTELYHHARVKGEHVLSSIAKVSLEAVRHRQFGLACDILRLFPRLHTLVAVMGWDLLAGDSAAKNRMMQSLLASRAAHAVNSSVEEEKSLIELLCDRLSYHLRLAFCVGDRYGGGGGGGSEGDASASGAEAHDGGSVKGEHSAYEFGANLVLELLAAHSPVRVLYDVVPEISADNALELIGAQPVSKRSASIASRDHDIELVHMSYAIQSAVSALQAMDDASSSATATGSGEQGGRVGGGNRIPSLVELSRHLDALSTPARRIWMIGFIRHLLHMDVFGGGTALGGGSAPHQGSGGSAAAAGGGQSAKASLQKRGRQKSGRAEDCGVAVDFISQMLFVLRQCLPLSGLGRGGSAALCNEEVVWQPGANLAWTRMTKRALRFIDDWEWRVEFLRRMASGLNREWEWREALSVLRASPSALLNMCIQRGEYALGEEVVSRFSLPPHEAASLHLAEWVDGVGAKALAEGGKSSSKAGGGLSDNLTLAFLQGSLSPLTSLMLYLDVAATAARSPAVCKGLLSQARAVVLKSQQVGGQNASGSVDSSSIAQHEEAVVDVAGRFLQRLQELQEQDGSQPLHKLLTRIDEAGEIVSTSVLEGLLPPRPRQRAVDALHQAIEDTFQGKRQFLSGKLHNYVKALSEEDWDESHLEAPSSRSKGSLLLEKGLGLGLLWTGRSTSPTPSVTPGAAIRNPISRGGTVVGVGIEPSQRSLLVSKRAEGSVAMSSSSSSSSALSATPQGSRSPWLTPTNKLLGYLPAFLHYIAATGDIVDDIDTTHTFNFFSLVYEKPNDLLTRLVFERGSTDAAGKVAALMGADLVHQVISACVPPVYLPVRTRGWAKVGVVARRPVVHPPPLSFGQSQQQQSSAVVSSQTPHLYPLQLDVVRQLAGMSPVRAILAAAFGGSQMTSAGCVGASQPLIMDKQFFDFAVAQAEPYPSLKRWLLLQSTVQKFVEKFTFPPKVPSREKGQPPAAAVVVKPGPRKRPRPADFEEDKGEPHEAESDPRGERIDATGSLKGNQLCVAVPEMAAAAEAATFNSAAPAWPGAVDWLKQSGAVPNGGRDAKVQTTILEYDWEDDRPYRDAVQRLMSEGKFAEALSMADKWLPEGAPDQLLQMLMEHEQKMLQSTFNPAPALQSWRFCIRLHDKQLAATLALKHLHLWDLKAALDVLSMCHCHLRLNDTQKSEVQHMRRQLKHYERIMKADGCFASWQAVEMSYVKDPEGLAMRLLQKGAVAVAVEVAEACSLPEELRRELQSHHVVKLMMSDPLVGGGAAAGLRFLESMEDIADILAVGMAAMKELPSLHLKQLLISYLLKRRGRSLPDAARQKLEHQAMGLRMLGALPLPWQQRCAHLHEHPRLILETLVMGKQLQAASQLLKVFPLLQDDVLIMEYAKKAIAAVPPPACADVALASTSGALPSPLAAATAIQAQAPKEPSRTLASRAQSTTTFAKEITRRAFNWTSVGSRGNRQLPPQQQAEQVALEQPQAQSMLRSSNLPATAQISSAAVARESGEGSNHGGSTYRRTVDAQQLTAFAASMGDERTLTGDPEKDAVIRRMHTFGITPNIRLFEALLELCTDEGYAARTTVQVCEEQIKELLSSQQLPPNAPPAAVEAALTATETFMRALLHAQNLLKKGLSSSSGPDRSAHNSGDVEEEDWDRGEQTEWEDGQPKVGGLSDVDELLELVVAWLARVQLLQSLLGAGVVASIDDLLSEESAYALRDRLIKKERYHMAVYACKKCKVDPIPAWEAWGRALLMIEDYKAARTKFRQAIKSHLGDPTEVVIRIVNMLEFNQPADIGAACLLYKHMVKSVSCSSEEALSQDAYLNVLHVMNGPTATKQRRLSEELGECSGHGASHSNGDDSTGSYLSEVRYEECVYYLTQYCPRELMSFMFRHGHYMDACLFFFPPDKLPPPPSLSLSMMTTPSSSPQRVDSLATDYGTLDELCEHCIAHGAIHIMERVILARNCSDPAIAQHNAAALQRVCVYCEAHRHFNHLYRFQVLQKDHVAAGLTCIQLFLNSAQQDQALRHLEHAKNHFDSGLSARQQATMEGQGSSRMGMRGSRAKTASARLTEEELLKFSSRVVIQMEVVKSFSDAEGPPWKYSLFGNPNDADTHRRRCELAELLVERNFDLAFRVIYSLNLPAVHIYAGVAASVAEKRKSGALWELLRNINSTIDDDDYDQVVGAAINVYVMQHRERPDRLIQELKSDHRKVLACVLSGRLKSAFQIASRANSVSDVQLVAHEARQSGALAVWDLCKQWLTCEVPTQLPR